MRNQLINKKGFTLIELVIVLAIAALVLAGVLIAVGGAQQSRRDSQRRADMGALASKLEESAGNNAGTYPANFTFPAGFPGNAKDPSTGNAYTPAPNLAGTSTSAIFYSTSYQCNGNNSPSAGGGGRQYAAAIKLESGDWYCVSNK